MPCFIVNTLPNGKTVSSKLPDVSLSLHDDALEVASEVGGDQVDERQGLGDVGNGSNQPYVYTTGENRRVYEISGPGFSGLYALNAGLLLDAKSKTPGGSWDLSLTGNPRRVPAPQAKPVVDPRVSQNVDFGQIAKDGIKAAGRAAYPQYAIDILDALDRAGIR